MAVSRELLSLVKSYCEIDYDEDDTIIEAMIEAANEELSASITEYDPENRTASETLALTAIVRDMYDNRGTAAPNRKYSFVIKSLIGHSQYKASHED